MEEVRSVYVVAEKGEYAEWMKQLWAGECPEDDPLYELVYPNDLRGEATAWGETPHWTILDAMTTSRSEEYDEVIRNICRISTEVCVEPSELDMWGNGLMLRCDSPSSEAIRSALMVATRRLIARSSITEEEFQRAEWWISHICNSDSPNLSLLRDLRVYYLNAGSPPLPSSRNFRLGFLMHAYMAIRNAETTNNPDQIIRAQKCMDNYLTYGEPSWYHEPYKSHSTIASGIKVKSNQERTAMLDHFRRTIQPEVFAKFGKAYKPGYLAIMGEDHEHMVDLHFYDWLTGSFVAETRPRLKVIERVSLGGDI